MRKCTEITVIYADAIVTVITDGSELAQAFGAQATPVELFDHDAYRLFKLSHPGTATENGTRLYLLPPHKRNLVDSLLRSWLISREELKSRLRIIIKMEEI